LGLYKSIKYLNISTNDLTSASIPELSALPNLTSLTAQRNKFIQLGDLSHFKDLQLLELDENAITSISDFYQPHTRVLTLSKNNIKSLLPTNKSKVNVGVEVLDLSSNGLMSLAGIEAFPNVTVLNISQNELTNLMGIERLTKLERLDVSSNKLPNIAALSTLSQCKNLKTIVCLDNKNIYEAFPEEDTLLVEVLSVLPNIQAFDQRIISVVERSAAATVKSDKEQEHAAKLVQEENERKAAAAEAAAKAKEEADAAAEAAKAAADQDS
jgi:Leucine-rich repeat (LRR) protein